MSPVATLLDPVDLGPRRAPNRVLFGPHPTNLGDERRFSARHIAYYERRARGGCGTIVVEEAAVHTSDWPYERSPLAAHAAPGWSRIADAVHRHGALCIAALGHTGGQGSSAYSQRELWAPSRVPEVNAREVPKWMEPTDIDAVIDGFARAARAAAAAGCDGVEINAGQHSLVRQFLSGLTNHRDDEWGSERVRFARDVIAAVRDATGNALTVGLRLSCDELAPWAGITPEAATDLVAVLAPSVDYLVIVRGAIFSVEQTRPDWHVPAGFNRDLCAAMRPHAGGTPVVLQGSVVDVSFAEAAIAEGVCDLVEMTRAQIAEPDLVTYCRTGETSRIRPCLRCNQACMVRDARNPIVSCVVEPSAGYEATESFDTDPGERRRVLVLGAGPAGLEAARTAALLGHDVRVVERDTQPGGLARVAGPGAPLVDWQLRELHRLGVPIALGHADAEPEAEAEAEADEIVLQCTGGRPGRRSYTIEPGAAVADIEDIVQQRIELPTTGAVVIHDPIGGPIGVALAESLGDRAVLVTPDNIAGNELSRTGDLAPANTRLQQRGVHIERRSILRTVTKRDVELEDRFTGDRRRIEAVALVDCGFRLPDDAHPQAHLRAGDCVAPRTLLEAVLEGRRAAHAVASISVPTRRS